MCHPRARRSVGAKSPVASCTHLCLSDLRVPWKHEACLLVPFAVLNVPTSASGARFNVLRAAKTRLRFAGWLSCAVGLSGSRNRKGTLFLSTFCVQSLEVPASLPGWHNDSGRPVPSCILAQRSSWGKLSRVPLFFLFHEQTLTKVNCPGERMEAEETSAGESYLPTPSYETMTEGDRRSALQCVPYPNTSRLTLHQRVTFAMWL